MKMDVKISNGKWEANGKSYDELILMEKKFMDSFFQEVKMGTFLRSKAAILVLLMFSSCYIQKGVLVKEISGGQVITSKNDTIPTRGRLLNMLEIGEVYNLHILNDRCVDASTPWKKKRAKIKSINQ